VRHTMGDRWRFMSRVARPLAGDPREPLTVSTDRMLIVGLAIIRAAQFAPGLVVVALVSRPGASPAGFWWFLLAVCLTAAVFADGLRHRRLRPWWVAADVAYASALALQAGHSMEPMAAVSWLNWTFAPLMGAASAAALALGVRWSLTAVAACTAAYVVGVAPWRGGDEVVVNAVGNGLSIVAFATASGLFAAALRRNAQRAQAAIDIARTLELEHTSEAARSTERRHQHHLLHDTVLATLTGLATGALDARDPRIQERCGRDAAFVRNLIVAETEPAPTNLSWAVSDVLRRHAGGIRDIHHQSDVEAGTLPPAVVAAFAHATTEALNNVERHAQTDSVWVTVTGDSERATVTVVDRGIGFDLAKARRGLGLAESVTHRMREIGGEAQVFSEPGEGTTVELVWPHH